MSQNIISVSTLVHYLKRKVESDSLIQKVLVEGEISNFSNYRSGHWYFSLKDTNSLIKCVMFSSYNKNVSFLPKDGDKVILQADLTVYEQRGDFQLTVYSMKSDSIGNLYLEFERLKKKLYEEGLFAQEHKKHIPKYPMCIALVTGANTAARSDVLTTLNRRWPIAAIIEYNALVQGKESADQIISSLLEADKSNADVILLVRGGGSIEDLWSFNDERLARTIYHLQKPIITGIGHEINYTIADYVADLRAPTPTGAAERCAPDKKDVLKYLYSLESRLNTSMDHKYKEASKMLESYKNAYVLKSPERLYDNKKMQIDYYENALNHCMQAEMSLLQRKLSDTRNTLLTRIQKNTNAYNLKIQQDKQKIVFCGNQASLERKKDLSKYISLLDAYSPLKSLQRGYALVEKNGETLKTICNINKDDTIQIHLSDGKIDAKVINVIERSAHGKKRNVV